MSHIETVRTPTMTTSSSMFNINTDYLTTRSGVCKLIQLVLGIICVALSGLAIKENLLIKTEVLILFNYELFFFVTAVTFMIGTFILLLCYIASDSTASTITKTIYEFIYHAIAFGLLLAASIVLVAEVDKYDKIDKILLKERYNLLLGASICGFLNAALYLWLAVISYRSYRSV